MRKLTLLLILALLPILANAQSGDPCTTGPKQKQVISQAASARLVIGSGASGGKIYICHFHIATALANNIALVEGTGATCGTGTAGLAGGTTAATGWNFGANGQINLGNGGHTVLQADAAAGDDLCLLQSAATQVSGVVFYVKAAQ